MLGGIGSVSTKLSSIYSSNEQALAESMAKIASGKRIRSPMDDFAGYVSANNINADIVEYQRASEDIAEGRQYTESAITFGEHVYEKLGELRDLALQFADLTNTTSAEADNLTAQHDALATELNTYMTSAEVDGNAIGATGTLGGAGINIGPSATLTMTLAATDIATPTSADITDVTAVEGEMGEAASYLAKVKSWDDSLQSYGEIADTVIAAKENHKAAITDVDDVKEMAKVTDMQVRQQAAVSMMAQANMSRQGMMQLFL